MIGVTFNIKYDDDYSSRYRKLHDRMADFGIVEDKSTSCLFLDTDDTEAVHRALYGVLDYRKDKAIVFTTYAHTLKSFGPT
ncbi:hypothetical protein [uncultured Marivita sp.]|uniref:hypothetical protein n=1 Tax=uncultured Marivita sp. TaxID=888080 RepID=UPI00262900D4|nr:hypothetical protein [uncultured Marivita sp.]